MDNFLTTVSTEFKDKHMKNAHKSHNLMNNQSNNSIKLWTKTWMEESHKKTLHPYAEDISPATKGLSHTHPWSWKD